MSKSYAVTYRRDEDGWWVAEVVGVSAATQGRTIEQARERVREAIASVEGVAVSTVVLGEEDVRE